MIRFADIDIKQNGDYIKLLTAASKLSGLFSDSAVPYINYRLMENVFCRSFDAKNLSRSDTAFDANYNSQGIGLKTFICNANSSLEKVAEFNSLASELQELSGKSLAVKLAESRNERINLAKRFYNLESSLYHIIGRREKKLLLFETDYDCIDIDNIRNVKLTKSKTGLQFDDGMNDYNFNFSKSTLYRRFVIPNDVFSLEVDQIDDPYEMLLQLFAQDATIASSNIKKGSNYVILPLYGYKAQKEKFVFEKSGLNQWNGGGRKRNIGEVYIPIPIEIHQQFPDFFPNKDIQFELEIPTGEVFVSKVCQENSKALMTNPNKDMSDWLLRKTLQLQEGELATIDKLYDLGFDSVLITKVNDLRFQIDIMKVGSYEDFIEDKNYILD